MHAERYLLDVPQTIQLLELLGGGVPSWMTVPGLPDQLPFVPGRHGAAMDLAVDVMPPAVVASIRAAAAPDQDAVDDALPPALTLKVAVFLSARGVLREVGHVGA
ncbi:hypothetical protein [Candidatus Endoriftia persephone]|uniref:Uncharacterized protein n=2 Tax=Gammaproteobacteria TaxID=1236 RepID=G2DH83_9GAMM|nr:hypothetical protein [Candidatus Endoriftia persephone]EGV50029.1 hypothetical protein Rifp1Sym_el00120 [endosymbiont of Riftia pachyptila (vent Ph05)]USF88765.1 hypothetical protein L0Y14_05900 [Candidatus Endoriftia persephone]